jgi:hypothetical protein
MLSSDALSDPAYTVPAVPPADHGVAWLRASVARFSSGTAHARRRALAVEVLAGIDPANLRDKAVHATGPVEVLAEALGLPATVADDIAVIARSYQPHTTITDEADRAVERLAAGTHDEATANRIALLVQACDATKALVAHRNPPIPATRRIGPDGIEHEVDLTDAPFGAGPHACPGRRHAEAIAAGLNSPLRTQSRPVT